MQDLRYFRSSAGPCLPYECIHGPSLEITGAYFSSSVDVVIIFSPKEVTSHYYVLEICLGEISAIRMLKQTVIVRFSI